MLVAGRISRRKALAALSVAVSVSVPVVMASVGLAACSPPVCKMGGINDASNRSLRRQMLSFGLGEFCKEMTGRDAPLRLTSDSPTIGRFYATRCNQRELSNGDLQVDFEGWGYAWTNVSYKVTFTAAGVVEYNQDFRCSDDGAIYAYFPVRQVKSSAFQMHVIEQQLASMAQSWIQPYADKFGAQTLGGKLGEGFTVIRDGDNVDFDIGIIPLGQHPTHPFRTGGTSKVVWENLRTEIHQEQRDFIGPITLPKAGTLLLSATLDGQPAADVFVLSKDEADPALRWYFDHGAATQLPTAPRMAGVMQQGLEYRQTLPLPAGQYYVVIDNTSSAGQVAPQNQSAAAVSYVIQIGDAP